MGAAIVIPTRKPLNRNLPFSANRIVLVEIRRLHQLLLLHSRAAVGLKPANERAGGGQHRCFLPTIHLQLDFISRGF